MKVETVRVVIPAQRGYSRFVQACLGPGPGQAYALKKDACLQLLSKHLSFPSPG